MSLVDVLKAQNEWWKTGRVPDALLEETKREEFGNAERLLNDERITAIIGPRRTGKTTLLYQLIQHLLKGVDGKRVIFFSMDDPSLRPYHPESLFEELLKTYFEEVLMEEKRKGKVYVFIDEIHFYEDWERWLKKYYDLKYPIKFIISSSSSAHLSRKSRESLVGRISEILLLPLSFKGYLSLRGKAEILDDYDKINFADIDPTKRFRLLKYDEELKILFARYLLWGGLPESVNTGDEIVQWQEKLISDVLRKVLYRDIVELYGVRAPSKLEDLFVHITYNTSKTFSYSSLSRNLNISIEAVMNYTRYLLESYLIGELKLFSKSIEKTVRSNRKYFIMDSGLQNAITKTRDLTDVNLGLLVESVVQKHLHVFARLNHFNSYYWRDKEEVDIILDMEGNIFPFEVKYKNEIRKSDIKGLLKFMDKFKVKRGFVITKDLLDRQVNEGMEVVLVPAWLFLLTL